MRLEPRGRRWRDDTPLRRRESSVGWWCGEPRSGEAPWAGASLAAGQTAAASGPFASIVFDCDFSPEISMRLGFGCAGFGTVTLRTPFS